ncbi:hypothetical protein GGX14DRAFT_543826 [Mycena pura]|uniref:Uncharacterized protein n=1 Tax=Mycena pura TaxID=153505 RepID=A0AAD6V9D5_9AGAR|nr:hypothetical protein GGX14DRAFT_543826 [Mycena pura]
MYLTRPSTPPWASQVAPDAPLHTDARTSSGTLACTAALIRRLGRPRIHTGASTHRCQQRRPAATPMRGETAGVAGPTLAREAAKQRRMRARLRTHLASTVAHIPARACTAAPAVFHSHARPDRVKTHRPTSTRTARRGRVCRATRVAVRKPARAADRARMRAADKPRRGQEALARRTARAWLVRPRAGQRAHAHGGRRIRRWTARAVDTTRTAVHAAAADSAPTRAANSAGGQRARRTARAADSARTADTARTADRKPTRPRRTVRARGGQPTRRTAGPCERRIASARGGGGYGPMRTADSERTRPRRIVRPRARGGQRARARRTGSPRADSAPMRTADSERTRRRWIVRPRAADSAGGQRAADTALARVADRKPTSVHSPASKHCKAPHLDDSASGDARHVGGRVTKIHTDVQVESGCGVFREGL